MPDWRGIRARNIQFLFIGNSNCYANNVYYDMGGLVCFKEMIQDDIEGNDIIVLCLNVVWR